MPIFKRLCCCLFFGKTFLECVLSLSEALAFPIPLEPQASRGGGLVFLKGCRVGARSPIIFLSPPGHPRERVFKHFASSTF